MRKLNMLTFALVIFAIIFLSSALDRTDPNYKHLKNLDPTIRRKFTNFLNDIKKLGYTPVIRDSIRSYQQQKIFHEQDKRNSSPGHSSHEMGFAIDMDLHKDGKILSKRTPKAIWDNTGVPDLAKEYNIRWGGNFKGYADNNHFDFKR